MKTAKNKSEHSFLDKKIEVGDKMIVIFGNDFITGIVSEILPYKEGFILPRIKIQGFKTIFASHRMIHYEK